jgi:hypothetical protein
LQWLGCFLGRVVFRKFLRETGKDLSGVEECIWIILTEPQGMAMGLESQLQPVYQWDSDVLYQDWLLRYLKLETSLVIGEV